MKKLILEGYAPYDFYRVNEEIGFLIEKRKHWWAIKVIFLEDQSFIGGIEIAWTYGPKIWYLECFSIHEKYRSLGIGSLVLEYVLSLAKTLKINEVFLKVFLDNLKAIKLYKKLGFTIVEKRIDYAKMSINLEGNENVIETNLLEHVFA